MNDSPVVLQALDQRMAGLKVPMTLKTMTGCLLFHRNPTNLTDDDRDFLCRVSQRTNLYLTWR